MTQRIITDLPLFAVPQYINGAWVPPKNGQYFDVVTPTTGAVFSKAARGDAADIEVALDAAHAAADKWGTTSPAQRASVLLKIAAVMQANLDTLAYVETVDNGKPIRESLAADLPLAIDHFTYFAGVLRSAEGSFTELDEHTVAYHHQEPLGVVGQIIPWNFPLLMAAWKLAPALAAGCCVVLKPAETTPVSIMVLMGMLGDIIPPGVVNIVNGYGAEAGAALASSKRIAKIAFTGSTGVGRKIAAAAAENMIRCTLELGGKSPNIFMKDVMDKDDDFLDKAIEGFTMFALNSGEVCTCPSRALIHEDIADAFLKKVLPRVKAIKMGNPLDPDTALGAQNSEVQMNRILGHIEAGKKEGAEVLIGGARAQLPGLAGGFYVEPTVFKGYNHMQVFQQEIFGPVVCVTTFKTMEEAIKLANDTCYGLGAGVWTRDVNDQYKLARAIKAGRIWCNNYHAYPAGATFGGYKESGIGRETHKAALEAYQQTKSMLVSYSDKALGFF